MEKEMQRGRRNIQAVITIIASIFIEVIPYVKSPVIVGSILKINEIQLFWILINGNEVSTNS